MNPQFKNTQRGITLVGLILVIAMIGGVAVLAMQVFPSFVEFNSIKKAITYAKANGSTVVEIRAAFDRQAEIGYITTINGKDLEIVKNGDDVVISFAYDKKIPIVGPASLLIEYAGTTATGGIVKKPVM